MIDKLRLLVLKIQWLKPVALVTGIASAGLLIYLLIAKAGSTQDDYLFIPSVIALLWSMMFFWFLYTFPGVPEKPTGDLGFFKRFVTNLKRFCYFILAILAFAATAGILIFTVRGLNVWVQSYG